jgi:hypothetical protein
MRLLDFYNLTNIDIDDPVMTTVGGVIFRLFGRLPKVGESVTYEAYLFTVLEVERLRIGRLHVSKTGQAEAEAAVELAPVTALQAAGGDEEETDTASAEIVREAGGPAPRGADSRRAAADATDPLEEP